MNALDTIRFGLAACGLMVLSMPLQAAAQGSDAAKAQPAPALRDGQRDFDWEIGTWKTHLKRLQRPLTGSTSWVELEGTTVVRKVWDGRANLVELDVRNPSGRIEALSLRLYNPESHQWSLNFSNSASGTLAAPAIGEFKNGRGEFYNQDTLNGRSIFVRFVIECASADSCRFEQAFSADGGKSWEINWIATDTRVEDRSDQALLRSEGGSGGICMGSSSRRKKKGPMTRGCPQEVQQLAATGHAGI